MTVVYLPRFSIWSIYFLLKLTFTLRDPKQAPLETQREKNGRSGCYCKPWQKSLLALPERGCDLLMKPFSPTKAGNQASFRWKLVLAEDWGGWTPGVIASTNNQDIYTHSHVCSFPSCCASLNFICNTANDPISLALGKPVTHVLWDTETAWFVT